MFAPNIRTYVRALCVLVTNIRTWPEHTNMARTQVSEHDYEHDFPNMHKTKHFPKPVSNVAHCLIFENEATSTDNQNSKFECIHTSFPSNVYIFPYSSLGRVWGFGVNGPRFKPRWSSFLSILWVFRFHNFMSKMSQESQVNLNFADYDKLGLRLSAISISPQSEERQVWPVGCPRAGCKIGRHQKWQRRLILKVHC